MLDKGGQAVTLEITPEMVEMGLRELFNVDDVFANPAYLVELIYRAMRSQAPDLSHCRGEPNG